MALPKYNKALYPDVIYTTAQLADYVNKDVEHRISFMCYRNPVACYKFIQQNDSKRFPPTDTLRGINDAVTINNLYKALSLWYNGLPENQQVHWLAMLQASIPPTQELINWTTGLDEFTY